MEDLLEVIDKAINEWYEIIDSALEDHIPKT